MGVKRKEETHGNTEGSRKVKGLGSNRGSKKSKSRPAIEDRPLDISGLPHEIVSAILTRLPDAYRWVKGACMGSGHLVQDHLSPLLQPGLCADELQGLELGPARERLLGFSARRPGLGGRQRGQRSQGPLPPVGTRVGSAPSCLFLRRRSVCGLYVGPGRSTLWVWNRR